MENIIHFLALFSLTATAIQLSLFRQWWQQLALAIIISAIIYNFYPIAIEYSSKDIEQLLANSTAMLDMSVVLVIEAVLMLILALFLLRDMYTRLTMPYSLVPLIQYLPTVSAVGILCFYQVHLYQQALPYNFETTALMYAAVVIISLVVLAWLIKFLLPARVLRLELKLAMHGAQIILAIATSVLIATHPYRQSDIKPNLTEFYAVIVLVLLGIIFGYFRHKKNMLTLSKKMI